MAVVTDVLSVTLALMTAATLCIGTWCTRPSVATASRHAGFCHCWQYFSPTAFTHQTKILNLATKHFKLTIMQTRKIFNIDVQIICHTAIQWVTLTKVKRKVSIKWNGSSKWFNLFRIIGKLIWTIQMDTMRFSQSVPLNCRVKPCGLTCALYFSI